MIFDPSKALIGHVGGFAPPETARLGAAICAALAEAVGDEGFHGGVRPDNISYEEGAAALGEPYVHGTSELTPEVLEYIAPELFWSGSRGPAADVYSVGLLLYAVLNGGRLPFQPAEGEITPDDRARAMKRRVKGEDVPAPRDNRAPELVEIVLRAVNMRPEERWLNAAELREALQSCNVEYAAPLPGFEPDARLFGKPREEFTEMERLMAEIIVTSSVAKPKAAEPEAKDASAPVAVPVPAPGAPGSETPAPPREDESPQPEGETPEGETAEAPADAVPVFVGGASVPAGGAEVPSGEIAWEAAPTPRPAAKRPPAPETRAHMPAPPPRRPPDRGRKKSRRINILLILVLLAAVVVVVAMVVKSFGVPEGPGVTEPPVDTGFSPSVPPAATTSVPTARPTPSLEPTPSQTIEPSPTPPPEPEVKYELYIENVSWEGAKRRAEELGGRLATISDAEEYAEVVKLFEGMNVSYVWIGAHRGADGAWVWESGEDVNFFNWHRGEPTYYDTDGTPENYLILWRGTGGVGAAWTYNDMRNDPISLYPGIFGGVTGFVVEYD